MNEKLKESTSIIPFKAGDSVLIDTCSIIESFQRYSFLLSKIKCFVISQAIKELTRVGKKEPKVKGLIRKFSANIIEETDEMKVEAVKLYRRYGLLWGLSYVDCLYLAAAKLNNISLMSCDRALIKVAEKEGVNVIPMHINQKKRKRIISVIVSESICSNVSFIDSTEEKLNSNIEVVAK